MSLTTLEFALAHMDPRIAPLRLLRAWCAWKFGWRKDVRRAVKRALGTR